MMAPLLRVCIAAAVLLAGCAPEPAATEPVARGRQVYRALNCGSCHEPDIVGRRVGPLLEHVGTVAATREPGVSADEYLRESIVSPGAFVVPGYPDSMPRGLERGLPQEDLDALVAYLGSLK